MRAEKTKRRKLRLKKKWKITFNLLFALILGITVYSYYQYKQGLLVSKGKGEGEQKTYHFNGKVDQFGGTNILLIGSDAREKETSRSDTIMVVNYHPDKKTFKLISIMRDTYVDIPGHGKNKINTAFAYGGPELLRKTIKENFDLDVQYYSIVDFQGFIHVIDEAFPEGVKINVEKRMEEYIDVKLEPGEQMMDGKHLLNYVRFRHDAIGDFGRVQRQQKVVNALANQFASLETIPKLPKLIGVVQPYISTNLSTGNMISITTDYMRKKEKIETLRIPVDGGYEDQSISGVGAVLRLDFEKNNQAIYNFLKK
ncbi:LCP family protein [Bacillus sp. DNRA2]|nr:LCP family protein [Bacillus sp. DNRA2]NMD70891.1 LCP family protein [Bacillus sp. DNRA2]